MSIVGKTKQLIHDFFLVGIILKGINAIIELLGGLLLYFLSNQKIVQIMIALTSDELSEDPRDKISHFLLQSAEQLSVGNRLFASFYLFSHGIIKLGLVIALLKRKLWAYPLAIAVFFLFIIYQMYKYTYGHSAWLIALSLFDLFVIVATWLEYRQLKHPIE